MGYDIVLNELDKRTAYTIVLEDYATGEIELQESHEGGLLQLEVDGFDYLSFSQFIFLL